MCPLASQASRTFGFSSSWLGFGTCGKTAKHDSYMLLWLAKIYGRESVYTAEQSVVRVMLACPMPLDYYNNNNNKTRTWFLVNL